MKLTIVETYNIGNQSIVLPLGQALKDKDTTVRINAIEISNSYCGERICPISD